MEMGQYTDYSDAISSMIQNQLLLQTQVSQNGSVVIESGNVRKARKSMSNTAKDIQVRMEKNVSERNIQTGAEHTRAKPNEILIPQLFNQEGIVERPSSFAPLPSDRWSGEGTVYIDKWIFGQYNRLLPVKASCRVLAHLLKSTLGGLAIEETTLLVAKEALKLSESLMQLDVRYGIPRDDSFSTAFPHPEKNPQKGCLRFANQFVAGVTKEGQLWGLLFELKLINAVQGKITHFTLTEPGWEFALLCNPVFDRNKEMPQGKFSDEEIGFLIKHIKTHVPVEDFAYRTILAAIIKGANTPQTLDEHLSKFIQEDAKNSVSKSFASTQRSGAISRMADLGLVSRKREGARVTYVMTERGVVYLQKM